MTPDPTPVKIPSKWIELDDLMQKYYLTEKSMRKLIDTGMIDHYQDDNKCLIDENSLKLYLESRHKKTLPREYNQEIMEKAKKNIDRKLKNYDDYIFLYKNVIEINYIFKWVIREIPYLIGDDLKYQVFKEIYAGDNVRQVMERHSISYNSVHTYCKEVRSILTKKSGFLQKYSECFQEKETKLTQLKELNLKYKKLLHE